MPNPRAKVFEGIFNQMIAPALTQFSNEELDDVREIFNNAIARIKASRNVVEGNATEVSNELGQ